MEVPLPNLRLYRAAWLFAAAALLIALFTLRASGAPALNVAPIAFQPSRAMGDLRTLCEQFPQRVAGSSADKRLAGWLVQTLNGIGLQTHIDSFGATVDGRGVTLQNVWAVSKGSASGTIVVLANRDVPPLATQGADDNASGVAIALELARSFTAAPHQRTIVFLFTDGDAAGALGARHFVDRNDMSGVIAAIALQRAGLNSATSFSIDGWSTSARVAPPWLWLLSASSARSATGRPAPLPDIFTQVLRLAVPSSAGSQGPFVAAGVPAVTISARGRHPAPESDILEDVSATTVGRSGSLVERLVTSIDASPAPAARSGNSLLLPFGRSLPGGVVELVLAAFMLPVALVALDLFARSRRLHVVIWPTWVRYAMYLAPLLFVLLIVYAANLLSLLPHTPGGIIPPESLVANNPRYLRVILLAVLLAAAYWYVVTAERRFARRLPTGRQATILVAHCALTVIAVLVFLVNPFSLLLLLPAAVLWPLARPGAWTRSLLPVWASLAFIAGALLFYALRVHIGLRVWWYFFLLFENRNIPVTATVLGAAFLAATAMLSATLHHRPRPLAESRPQPTGRPPMAAAQPPSTDDTGRPANGDPRSGPSGPVAGRR